MIYLDQAATSFPKPTGVGEAICSALASVGNSGRGAHDLSLMASRLVFETRQELSGLFGAPSPSTIAFTANATESLNLALRGLLNSGDHVITTAWEHNSVLRPLYRLENGGLELSILPCNSQGALDLTKLGELVQPNTKALVCTHASNVTGNLLDLDYLGRWCAQNDLLFIVDGAQTVGAIPLDVQKQNIDVLCFTGHKSLYGPQGIGGIYVRPGLKIDPLKVGGTGTNSFSKTQPTCMPEALEAGTLNIPGIAGLRAGLRFIKTKGITNIEKSEQQLTQYFYQQLNGINTVRIYGDFSTPKRCPIISLNLSGISAAKVSQILAEEYKIYTRAGVQCAPLLHQSLGTTDKGVVRFSFSYFNTEEELDQALAALLKISKG